MLFQNFLVALLVSVPLKYAYGLPRYSKESLLQNLWQREKLGEDGLKKYYERKASSEDEQLLSKYTSIEDQVKFYLYTRMNLDTYQELVFNNETTVKNSYIDFGNPTSFIVHGYFDSITSDVIQSIKKNLLARENHNVIGVDWSAIADTIIYSNAANSVPEVGQYVSQFLQFLMGAGQSLSEVHLIGHSLGAHVVGLAGRNLSLTTQEKVPRITGLDPAKPGFYDADVSGRLDVSDAEFVDCIHTCSGELGLGKPVCTADYYPNGASGFQPGCPIWDVAGVCSHGRSYDYYAESILLNHKFIGSQCQTVPQDSTSSNCAPSGALMGDPATPEFKGIFLVVTNAQYPYSQDIVNSTQKTT